MLQEQQRTIPMSFDFSCVFNDGRYISRKFCAGERFFSLLFAVDAVIESDGYFVGDSGECKMSGRKKEMFSLIRPVLSRDRRGAESPSRGATHSAISRARRSARSQFLCPKNAASNCN